VAQVEVRSDGIAGVPEPGASGIVKEEIAGPIGRRRESQLTRLIRQPALGVAPRVVVDEARDARPVGREAREGIDAPREIGERGRERLHGHDGRER
jgi:hypothetical protein